VHVQGLISIVKMATVLEDFTTEEQCSVALLLWAKGLNAKDIHKKKFLFVVGSVCCRKRFTTGSIYFVKDIQELQMMSDQITFVR
jgi:hypothetical protein